MILEFPGTQPAADPVSCCCLVTFSVLLVLFAVCCSFKFESSMNAFVICVVAALVGMVLVGEAFEDWRYWCQGLT